MAKFTFWWWIKAWLQVSFSREMWGSLFFLLLYVICFIGQVQSEFNPLLLLYQAGFLVLVALFFGLLAAVVAWFKLRRKFNGPS